MRDGAISAPFSVFKRNMGQEDALRRKPGEKWELVLEPQQLQHQSLWTEEGMTEKKNLNATISDTKSSFQSFLKPNFFFSDSSSFLSYCDWSIRISIVCQTKLDTDRLEH